MLTKQLFHLMLKLAPRTKLKMKGILSPTTDSVRETTTPNVRLPLTTGRQNQITNPIQINILRD